MEKHQSVHDKSKGLVCTWRGCKKILGNKDSLKQHVERHQDLKLKCDQCQESRSYPTTMSLKQHQQGQHGNGYITYCGQVCKWPDERRKHQKECLACGKAKEKKLNKEQNPRNPRKRTKTFKNRGVPKKPKVDIEKEETKESDNEKTESETTNDDTKTPESDNGKTATEEQKIDNTTIENGNTNESSDTEKQTLSENNKDDTPKNE